MSDETKKQTRQDEISAWKGAERRRHRRFDCQGQAEVIVADAEFLFRGDIRDLSLSGCFVATRARRGPTAGMPVVLWFMVAG